jgi:hypothetical protein
MGESILDIQFYFDCTICSENQKCEYVELENKNPQTIEGCTRSKAVDLGKINGKTFKEVLQYFIDTFSKETSNTMFASLFLLFLVLQVMGKDENPTKSINELLSMLVNSQIYQE